MLYLSLNILIHRKNVDNYRTYHFFAFAGKTFKMPTLVLQIGFICSLKLWGLFERGLLINMGIRLCN